MNASSSQIISDETMHSIVQQTFSILVDCDAQPHSTADYQSDDLSLAVYCDKQQQSAVIVRCSRALATALAGQLLEMPAEEVGEPDRLDTVGEIVNVIAGSLRGLMPLIGVMSTPFAIAPADLDTLISDSYSTNYTIKSEPFHLYTMLNHTEEAA